MPAADGGADDVDISHHLEGEEEREGMSEPEGEGDEWHDVNDPPKPKAQPSDRERVSRSPPKVKTALASRNAKRRRNSIRRGAFSPKTSTKPQGERGRQPLRPTLASEQSTTSIHSRVESLKQEVGATRRERSPSPSVRWDDLPEPHSKPHAHRLGRSPLHSRPPSPDP